MGTWSVWHWVVVLIVLVLLFGSKRLPDAARGLGRSLRILKSEVRQMNAEGESESSAADDKPAGSAPAQKPAAEPAAISAAPQQQTNEQASRAATA
jgi:sec-independent protein translocase protein TatA